MMKSFKLVCLKQINRPMPVTQVSLINRPMPVTQVSLINRPMPVHKYL